MQRRGGRLSIGRGRSGDRATLLTRYEDVKHALSDPRLSREGLARPDAARITASEAGSIFDSPMARALNAEGQQRWRRMVGKWFTAKRMQALVPKIEATADRLIDGMLEHGQPADLVRHLAFPLAVYVICDMLGVPDRGGSTPLRALHGFRHAWSCCAS
ncbi:hypothetical protein ACWEWG_01325 [Streptomyces sp. NPDC003758]|uniref:Cytochrome P450 n=1 Tax=Streptomyces cynarae TaxID=2981134 RepID=A0ABY6DVV7_9ACTN|nr:hypothetical protein [Streptomyces cynarae]UXY17843.1 hypothetical protein N8I84_03150 [Streptomyces cynarae]